MTNYEIYLQEKPVIERVCRNINAALGRTEKGELNKNNDKASFEFRLDAKSVELGYGYYGSSSYYRCDDAETIACVQKACRELAPLIGERAIKIALEDLESKRINAVAEARKVFSDCESPL